VFTGYTGTLEDLRDALVTQYGETLGCYSREGGQIRVDGEWKSATRDVITERLRLGQLKVLVCTDAASEGPNLQAAGALINYDLPWNPSKIEQRMGRMDRIGQGLNTTRRGWCIQLDSDVVLRPSARHARWSQARPSRLGNLSCRRSTPCPRGRIRLTSRRSRLASVPAAG
jgi:superfamily II DNA/RNA helicase